jgi:hypothetical protein
VRSAEIIEGETEDGRGDQAHNDGGVKVLPVTTPIRAPHPGEQVIAMIAAVLLSPEHN